MDRTSPAQAFVCQGNIPRSIPLCAPTVDTELRRIIVFRAGGICAGLNGGPWKAETTLMAQYKWNGGHLLTDTTTPLLRTIQNQNQAAAHLAIRKWETKLHCRLPE